MIVLSYEIRLEADPCKITDAECEAIEDWAANYLPIDWQDIVRQAFDRLLKDYPQVTLTITE